MSLATEEALGAGGLRVKQIAELLGREKSQVSRALTTLGESGLVERNAESTYRLGWRLHMASSRAGTACSRPRSLAAGWEISR